MECDARTRGPECPDCGATASIEDGVCDVCLADLGERHGRHPGPEERTQVAPVGLRFSDVMTELRAVVDLAGAVEAAHTVAAAGRRAERLLDLLREQFLRDLGAPVTGAARGPVA